MHKVKTDVRNMGGLNIYESAVSLQINHDAS